MGLKLEELAKEIIGAAIEFHKGLGAGLRGPATEFTEYTENGQGTLVSMLSASVLSVSSVARAITVEIKCVNELLPVHEAQLLTYMRLGGSEVGLLINAPPPKLRSARPSQPKRLLRRSRPGGFPAAALKQGLRREVL